MRPKPKSRFEAADGSMIWWIDEPEYPDRVAWDIEYRQECDRYSELEAVKTDLKRWGRWYLKGKILETWRMYPNIGKDGARRGSRYEIPISQLEHDWNQALAEKDWIGQRGLQDLTRALQELTPFHPAEIPPCFYYHNRTHRKSEIQNSLSAK